MVVKGEKKNKLWVLLSLSFMLSCQSIQSSQTKSSENSLSSDSGFLDLSLSTLEQQNTEKLKAEKFLSEARKKRIIITPEQIEETYQNSDINLARYARQASNLVGEKIYVRLSKRNKKSDPCFRFISDDDSQRFFLEKGGPVKDLWNLDPDGDGFACKWNPDSYKKFYSNLDS